MAEVDRSTVRSGQALRQVYVKALIKEPGFDGNPVREIDIDDGTDGIGFDEQIVRTAIRRSWTQTARPIVLRMRRNRNTTLDSSRNPLRRRGTHKQRHNEQHRASSATIVH